MENDGAKSLVAGLLILAVLGGLIYWITTSTQAADAKREKRRAELDAKEDARRLAGWSWGQQNGAIVDLGTILEDPEELTTAALDARARSGLCYVEFYLDDVVRATDGQYHINGDIILGKLDVLCDDNIALSLSKQQDSCRAVFSVTNTTTVMEKTEYGTHDLPVFHGKLKAIHCDK